MTNQVNIPVLWTGLFHPIGVHWTVYENRIIYPL